MDQLREEARKIGEASVLFCVPPINRAKRLKVLQTRSYLARRTALTAARSVNRRPVGRAVHTSLDACALPQRFGIIVFAPASQVSPRQSNPNPFQSLKLARRRCSHRHGRSHLCSTIVIGAHLLAAHPASSPYYS